MPRSIPLALPPVLPSELLEYVLSHQAYPTTIIICQPRASFLTSLLNSVDTTPHDNLGDTQSPLPRHNLLVPTLHQIATSKHINLVFVPTVSHLRAVLPAFPPTPADEKPPLQKFDKPGRQVPLLVVYGLVELHRDTSEWSAQGLSNSVSNLVEAGWRSERRVVAIEDRGLDEEYYETVLEEGEEEGVEEGTEDDRKWKQLCKVWEQRVPILNGSVKRAGLDSEDGAWSGRTVEVGRVLGRWFRFGRGDRVT
ncbi:hypothetical protein HYALB_00002315 [Hymenoscyphus albidus]|uniref:Uncharacterized protein n=1 Tax=Hymenoscyphus albidus TaxID=595503 RepID=A0A9N9QCI1_9HELO|nr:hypothetical protein HYALB_00002315 [Hymenoscyphus albidus]